MTNPYAYVAYVRVSTVRQGEQGVSLQAQRDAILAFARREGLEVAQWFEERLTAAKAGRPVFEQVIRLLRKRRARGLIVHKIDRSARNHGDWDKVEHLVDEGIDIRFAADDIDLSSRGGRLAAGIQVVVAADYIRNLREEAMKGIRGRLQQGVYPFPAPLGYLNQGAGKPKAPDPARAHLIRRAFEVYAEGQHALDALRQNLAAVGLVTREGKTISLSHLAKLLRNPFYMGVIRLHTTGETFAGAHQPIITPSLFQSVQDRLDGKVRARRTRHEFVFSRLLTCGHCSRRLIGERQKGRVYYRCHTHDCKTGGVREDALDKALSMALSTLRYSPAEQEHVRNEAGDLIASHGVNKAKILVSIRLQRDNISTRLDRLTDALLDASIDAEMFNRKKQALLFEDRRLQGEAERIQGGQGLIEDRLAKILELAFSAWTLYNSARGPQKRTLVETVTSNRTVRGKNLELVLPPPFSLLARREEFSYGGPGENRTPN